VEVQYKTSLPDEEEFFKLYETTGWNEGGRFSKEDLSFALRNSWFLVSAYGDPNRLIGFGRIISNRLSNPDW
jgi:hypothetical protein